MCSVSGTKTATLFDASVAKDLLKISFGNTVEINPFDENFPKELVEHSYQCEIKSGEILFIPHYFYHFIGCKTKNISVNFFVLPNLVCTKSKIFDQNLLYVTENNLKNEILNLKQKKFPINQILNDNHLLKVLLVNSIQAGFSEGSIWDQVFEDCKSWLINFVILNYYTF